MNRSQQMRFNVAKLSNMGGHRSELWGWAGNLISSWKTIAIRASKSFILVVCFSCADLKLEVVGCIWVNLLV
jgi:hypothetical protein